MRGYMLYYSVFHQAMPFLETLYSCAVESILKGDIINQLGNCSAWDHRALQSGALSVQCIIGFTFPTLQDLTQDKIKYISRASRIMRMDYSSFYAQLNVSVVTNTDTFYYIVCLQMYIYILKICNLTFIMHTFLHF